MEAIGLLRGMVMLLYDFLELGFQQKPLQESSIICAKCFTSTKGSSAPTAIVERSPTRKRARIAVTQEKPMKGAPYKGAMRCLQQGSHVQIRLAHCCLQRGAIGFGSLAWNTGCRCSDPMEDDMEGNRYVSFFLESSGDAMSLTGDYTVWCGPTPPNNCRVSLLG